jgi:hypothetical protein
VIALFLSGAFQNFQFSVKDRSSKRFCAEQSQFGPLINAD